VLTSHRTTTAGYLAYQSQYVLTPHRTTTAGYLAYQSAVVITNFLLLVNFAVNFVLYCVVNVQFRHTCSALLTWFLCRLVLCAR